ncbi:hypothetical protein GRS48_13010 [Halorubrum sp. JWXQ-INN 858]|uniref:hypothetical protein n=1 Tax=Halorubrum sp. JWXQ-INN 858 TaxID=2690782 RepID=UPI00135BF591|nr:hypothetical protein [Halorubrum sp. JWXQ-INN 858]MWV65733.1 hypothetical protein [Halorubrum sp. JWXQ-INN 858]
MERRKFVIGMGALATGSAAAIGTGASSITFEGERQAQLMEVGDDDALVRFVPGDTGVVRYDSNDTLAIDFEDSDADGFNKNGKTVLENAFYVENQSEFDIDVWFGTTAWQDNGPAGDVIRMVENGNQDNDVLFLGTYGGWNYEETILEPGDSVGIDIIVDTTAWQSGDVVSDTDIMQGDIRINAKSVSED